MADRRRANGPLGGTKPALFVNNLIPAAELQKSSTSLQRDAQSIRKIFLKTGLIPSASGSAYLELEAPQKYHKTLLIPGSSCLKLTCSVHAPRPLPRSAPFSPHMQVSAIVKFAPFASRERRGYLRDHTERDLAAHLETAIRGIVLTERWPKSNMEIIITILEGADHGFVEGHATKSQDPVFTMMSILSGCITVASAAIADAGIDCVDIVAGGVAAVIEAPPEQENATSERSTSLQVVIDPEPHQYGEISAACSLAYLQSRDEVASVWIKGSMPSDMATQEALTEGAVKAATASALVIKNALRSSA